MLVECGERFEVVDDCARDLAVAAPRQGREQGQVGVAEQVEHRLRADQLEQGLPFIQGLELGDGGVVLGVDEGDGAGEGRDGVGSQAVSLARGEKVSRVPDASPRATAELVAPAGSLRLAGDRDAGWDWKL